VLLWVTDEGVKIGISLPLRRNGEGEVQGKPGAARRSSFYKYKRRRATGESKAIARGS